MSSYLQPSPPPDASGTLRGLVSLAAQTFAGVKTFAATLIASAGIQLSALWNTNGTGASDVGVKVGVSTADGSVHASAKLLSVRTGIGGSEMESFAFYKNGIVAGGAGAIRLNDSTHGAQLDYGPSIFQATSSTARALAGTTMSVGGGAGAGASDVSVKIGSTTADASVNNAARLLTARTGIGGTEVEYFAVTKADARVWCSGTLVAQITAGVGICGQLNAYYAFYIPAGNTSGGYGSGGSMRLTSELADGAGSVAGFINTTTAWSNASSRLWSFRTNAVEKAAVLSSGRFDQSGDDSSGSPGAATINKPTGKSAIASGSATVVITNSLVAAGDQVHITWHGDHGQIRDWVTTAAGSFTVNLNAAASANTAFCWTVAKRL